MTNKHKNQNGMASIIIVTVIIVLLSLITIGFARIMDKEYRQAVDRELASQANYAAESGMNDARAHVIDQIKNGGDPDTNGRCADLSNPPFVPDGNVSGFYSGNPSNNTVKYTCVIIDTHPKDITLDLNKGQSRVIKIVPESSINNLYFSWNNKSAPTPAGPQSLGAIPNLPEENSVGPDQVGMLRTTIYPALSSGSTDNTVTTNQGTFFLYSNFIAAPGGKGLVGYGPLLANEGIVAGNCNAQNITTTNNPLPYKADGGYYCNTEVTGVISAPFYYIRLTALYQDLHVSLQAEGPGGNVKLDDAQAVLDVTGEGNNVLKRIRGRLALSNNTPLPEYTLQSMDTICKRLRLPELAPGVYGPAVIDDPPSGGSDPACQPSS